MCMRRGNGVSGCDLLLLNSNPEMMCGVCGAPYMNLEILEGSKCGT